MSVADLAGAAAGTQWETTPVAVRERIVDVVADCLAVTALGSIRDELSLLVASYEPWAGNGRATVVGSARGWPPGTAALLNGCAVASDQLQDGHRLARGHPGSHVVPAVLALAEATDGEGSELLSAVLAGYEVGVRLGRAMGGTPEGVHDIGTWGEVAAAVGVARLLAPNRPDVMHRAIELAASTVLVTDADSVFTGASGSHLFLGVSVQLGLSAGTAAVSGLAAAPGSVDRHFGARAAADWRPELLTAGVSGGTWSEYEVLGGYLKRHPTCAHLHGVNDAVEDLIADGLRAADVSTIEVSVPSSVTRFAAVADGELAARFSIPTSVAVAVVSGRLDETSFDAATVRTPQVRDLAGRVRVGHDPALDSGYPAGRPATVRVLLRDGSARTAVAARPRGDADRWPSRDVVADKVNRLLGRRFGDRAAGIAVAIQELAEGGRPRQLGDLLRTAAEDQAR